MEVYSLSPSESKPVTCAQRDKLRELQKWLSIYCWRRLASGNQRRVLAQQLVAQIDAKVRRAAA